MAKNIYVSGESGISLNKLLIHKLLSQLKKDLGITIVSLPVNFVHGDSIHEINKSYLNHDFTTDIITFNYSGDNRHLDGEIFISIEDAAENAEKFNCSLDNELVRLIVHGILHLMGFDDTTVQAKKIMKKEEDRLTNHFEKLTQEDNLIYDSKNC
ncbi:MAG: rRNA maturation RNase YbeY [Methanococcaceae archaeon]